MPALEGLGTPINNHTVVKKQGYWQSCTLDTSLMGQTLNLIAPSGAISKGSGPREL